MVNTMTKLPNTMRAEVYITSMDSVVWSFVIDKVPGLIRYGINTKVRLVKGIKYMFPSDDTMLDFLKGYVIIGGIKVGVETTDAGETWNVMYKKSEV